MKKLKNVIALFLAVGVFGSLLAGCTASTPKASTTPETTVGTAATTAAETTVAATTEAPATEAAKEPAKKVTVVVTRCANDSSAADSTDNAEVWAKIHDSFMAETNIDLDLQTEFILWAEAQNKLQMKFAADERLDVFAVAEGWMAQWTAADLGPFRSIDAELAKYAPDLKKNLDPNLFKLVTRFGQVVALPTDGLPWNYGIMVRKDIVEGLGLALPTSLDEFNAMLKAMKDKYPDSIPIAAPLGQIHIAGEFWTGANTAGTSWVIDKAKDRVDSWGQGIKYLDYMDMQRNWIKNGWLSKDNAQHQFEDAKKMIYTDKSFVYVSDLIYDELNKELQKTTPKAEMVPLMTGKTIYGEDVKMRWSNPTVVRYGVYKNAEQTSVEAFIQYYNWSAKSAQNYQLTRFGIEGKHFTIENGKLMIPAALVEANDYKSLYGFFATEKIPGYNLQDSTVLDSSVKMTDLLNKAPTMDPSLALYGPGDLGAAAAGWSDAWTKYNEALANFVNGKITRAEAEEAFKQYLASDGYKNGDAEIQRQYQEQKKAAGQ